jgi:RNA polymerase sigma-70 factor, ECF subfamily
MDQLAVFNQHRSLLFAIAYRMLGSATDAEDILQEAWIRWQLTQTEVRSPKSFLSCLATRLCIDRLRAARVQREQYVGTWLPEPMISEPHLGDNAELAESLSFAFLRLLECLSPTERAVFLLREVFDYDYSEIAQVVGKSVANCRQIVRRSRQHLALRRPGIAPPAQQKTEMVEQFLQRWTQGDLPGLMQLLAEDVIFWSDGGGKATAAEYPLKGDRKVARFLVAVRRSRLFPPLHSQRVAINDQPGILNTVTGNPQSTFSFEFVDRRIQTIFAVVNPAKLKAAQLLN